jgi:hypothetical protein
VANICGVIFKTHRGEFDPGDKDGCILGHPHYGVPHAFRAADGEIWRWEYDSKCTCECCQTDSWEDSCRVYWKEKPKPTAKRVQTTPTMNTTRTIANTLNKNLPKYLHEALRNVAQKSGDDLYFVLGHVGKSSARSYMSQLKKRGLAYTYSRGGIIEVWPHKKGVTYLANCAELKRDGPHLTTKVLRLKTKTLQKQNES